MRTNVGDGDRTLRLLLGAISGFVFVMQRVTGTMGTVLGLVSVYLLATSVTGWCPFYALFRISTHKPDDLVSR